MCRFSLYLGDELTVSSLVTEPANSIIHQSFHSHERIEPLNGDGFGLAWYAAEHTEPALFKEVNPAWNSFNLQSLARVTRTRCLLAHVRAATPGLPVTQLNCHPFTSGRLAFMHNGELGGFRAVRRALLAQLSDEAFHSVRGSTDSEHVFALLLDRYGAHEDLAPLDRLAAALEEAIGATERLRARHGVAEPSQLNLCLGDGERAVASRFVSAGGEPSNTLYVHHGRRYECVDGLCRMLPAGRRNRAVIVSSEPLSDDEGWQPVPENHLVLVDAGLGVTMRPIDLAHHLTTP
ncbi:MAG: class II glutamine amidotransferase [Acidobacteriota bacterium]|nr:class II glutamine amidotransferase [Acidobacteriota bacterium]MDH3522468.1 class II glutamine amidotransferase [Acidobacteriota bacterium]